MLLYIKMPSMLSACIGGAVTLLGSLQLFHVAAAVAMSVVERRGSGSCRSSGSKGVGRCCDSAVETVAAAARSHIHVTALRATLETVVP